MALKWLILFFVLPACSPGFSATNEKVDGANSTHEIDQDFYKWKHSKEGRKASLAQMKQRCIKEVDAEKNLNCSLFVLSKMFELKAANQIPDYYQRIKKVHSKAVEKEPELRAFFSMLGPESLSALMVVPDFSTKQTANYEAVAINPYKSDFYISEQAIPHVMVSADNGYSTRLILDTGAAQTRVNYDTAKKMGVRMLADSHYSYKTFYDESTWPVRLGILDYLKVGSVEFKNILVFVSDEESLLGLDLISKLGKFRITKTALELNAAPPERCDSAVVHYHAPLELDQRLTFVTLLDGRPTMAIIDTGNNDFLSSALPGEKNNTLLSEDGIAMQRDAVLGTNYQTFKGLLALPNNSMSVEYKYSSDYAIPPSLLFGEYVPSLLFGWQAFDTFELHLDIESGRSCFNKI